MVLKRDKLDQVLNSLKKVDKMMLCIKCIKKVYWNIVNFSNNDSCLQSEYSMAPSLFTSVVVRLGGYYIHTPTTFTEDFQLTFDLPLLE